MMPSIDIKSPAVQKALLCLVAGTSLLAVFFFTHFLPFGFPNQREKIEALKGDYEKKATELSRARATVADLPRFEAEYARLHERWTEAAELLPTERQLPVLMRRITLSAQQNGVNFMAFRPGGPKAEQHYTETPIHLSVYGDYHQIGSFMADLANMRRIVTVGDVQLKTNTRGKTSATTSADFTASAYHLTTTPATPAAATTPPAADTKKKEDEHEHKQS
jgi:type IV pilus assembly protein PilO